MDILAKAIEMNGKQATIINTNAEVILKPVADSYKDSVNFNYLFTYAGVSQGNLITIDNVTYLVVEKENNLVDTYNKCTITKTQTILWKGKEIQGYVRALQDAIDKTEYFNILANKIEITIPEMNIEINDIVSYKNSDFKIISIDNTKDGLLTIVAEYVKKAEPISYTIETPKEITVNVGENATVEIFAKKNGVIDSKATLIYAVKDNSICTIENKVINGLKEGSTTITVSYNNVSTTFNIIVKAKEVIKPVEPTKPVVPETPKEDFNGKFTINGAEQIMIGGDAETFTLDPIRKTVQFKIEDTTIGEIVSQGDGKCTVKALSDKNYLHLMALTPSGTQIAESWILTY